MSPSASHLRHPSCARDKRTHTRRDLQPRQAGLAYQLGLSVVSDGGDGGDSDAPRTPRVSPRHERRRDGLS